MLRTNSKFLIINDCQRTFIAAYVEVFEEIDPFVAIRETFFGLRKYAYSPYCINRKVSWSVSSILPNKIGRSALLSHPLALASKLMSSLQHYTVQTLIPSPSHPKAHHLSTPLPVYPLCALLGLLSKPALNHTSANDAARGDGKELS